MSTKIELIHDSAELTVAVASDAESLGPHIEAFRNFLISVGYHRDTVAEFIPEAGRDWAYID